MEALDCALAVSRSQYGEDLALLEPLLRIAEGGGTFVEIGALDGLAFSNTLALERCFGWRGLLIEANSANFRALTASGRTAALRHSAVCAGEGGRGATVNITRGGEAVAGTAAFMSPEFLRRHRRGDDLTSEAVPCQSLSSLVYQSAIAPRRLTFLSLDVEGAEHEALRHGAPKAAIVMVEIQGGRPAKNRAVDELLRGAGYRFARGVSVPGSALYAAPGVHPEQLRRKNPLLPAAMRLPGAKPGHCGVTEAGVGGDCNAGRWGSWALGRRFNVSACLQRCARDCSRCRFVSVSLRTRDCSWYWDCPDAAPLPDAQMDHQTVRLF